MAGGSLVGGTWMVRNCLYNVDAGQRSIKFNRFYGIGETVYEEGTHLRIPWVERPIIYDVRYYCN